jgi:hypothetical protein
MAERLKELRLLILNLDGARTQKTDPALLMFPEEFEKLEPGLNAFMRGAFQENPYQETPILRGIYFSSGRQEGTPYSHFLNAMGLIGEKEVLPGTNRGLFLHDFFSRILPADRGLFAPTQKTMEWSRMTKSHRADGLGCRHHGRMRPVELFIRKKPEDPAGRVRPVLQAACAAGRTYYRRADTGPFPSGREPG